MIETGFRSRDPFLRVSVSIVSSLVSVLKTADLETLNIAMKWYSKIYITQQLLFVVFAGKKQPKPVEKMPEIWNKIRLRSDDGIKKTSAKSTNFEVSSLGIFGEVSVSKF